MYIGCFTYPYRSYHIGHVHNTLPYYFARFGYAGTETYRKDYPFLNTLGGDKAVGIQEAVEVVCVDNWTPSK